MDLQHLQELCKRARYEIVTSTTAAKSGHPTSSLSATELMVSLMFGGYFRYRLEEPDYHNNDRLIFSKGHASPLFYALWALAGKVSHKEMLTLRQFDSRLEGHPTMRFSYTEVPTGSLGQGLSVGVGMALSGKMDKLPFKTYVLLGDSEMAEGSNWEAMQLAAHYNLDNLVAIVDVNRLGQRGETMFGHRIDSYVKKAEAFGWHPIEVDGHNLEEVNAAFSSAKEISGKPVIIVAKTFKGAGFSIWQDKENWHSKQLDGDQLEVAISELGDFDKNLIGNIASPEEVNLSKESGESNIEVTDYMAEETFAIKKAAGIALQKLGNENNNLVVLDAEVSNSSHTDLFKQTFPERFIECFIMEQNMVGAATGISKLGKHPVVNSFGAFLSRAIDQIRVLGQSELPLTMIGSYAGTSLGLDGGSQMALEDLAWSRTIWNSVVLYPADATSTEGVVRSAVDYPHFSYIRTTREPVPHVYSSDEQFSIGGSKTLKESGDDQVTLVGAGITLHECLKAYEELENQGITARVIDVYSIKPIDGETLVKACKETNHLIVVEDHYPDGGIAEAVRSALIYETTPIHSLAVRKLPRSGKPEELLAYEEIDAAAIVKKVTQIIG